MMGKKTDGLAERLDELEIGHRVMEDLTRVNRIYIRNELLEKFVELMEINEKLESS